MEMTRGECARLRSMRVNVRFWPRADISTGRAEGQRHAISRWPGMSKVGVRPCAPGAERPPTRPHTAKHPWHRSGVFMRRRDFLTAAVAATGTASTALMLAGRSAQAVPAARAGLASMTAGAKAIPVEERLARIAKLQRLMVEQKIGALILESGSSLDYFTGVQWHR